MAQSFVKCEICDERECALICLDCDQYFCQKCKEGHIKTKTTKHHQFLDSGTFQPQYKKLRCTEHEHHFIFFCERCETLVCPVCLPENHQEHRMLKIGKVASIKKKELNETLKIFVTKLNEFDSEVSSIQSITEKCKGENKDVIQHVDEQAKHISNVLENQRRCIIKSVKQKAKTEEKRISILLEDLQHCMKEAKELERKVKLDLQGSETSLLSNFQLRKSKLDTFEFNDTTISTCSVQFAKFDVPKEELSLLESVFSGNLCGLSEHEERNTLKNMMSMHDRKMKELQKELKNQIHIREELTKACDEKYNDEISKLQHQTTQLEIERDTITKDYQTVCKERDELKSGSEMEEAASLKILNERLREQNHEMSHGIAVYQEEQTDMLDMLKSLPSILTQIDQVTNKDYLKEFKLPYKQNEFMNKCTKAIEAVVDGYIKMKASLLKSQQECIDKFKDIAEWTTKLTSDTAEQMKVFHEQQQKTAIYKTDIQLKIYEIEKLSFKNEELIELHRTLEKQFYDIKILNKKVVEEKEKLKKEFNDLQKRLENQKGMLKTRHSIIEKLNGSILKLESEIGKRDKKMQLLTKENDSIKTKDLQLNENCTTNKQDLESTKHRLLHLQSNNFNLEKDIQVLRREKDDLQTRLSSVAGEKLTKGNPSITDLGDPNRPMKIGEKYGELYDNEWTDAMENVQNVKKYYGDLKDVEMEEILIRHLHRLLKCCYKDCFEMADGQLQKLGMTFAETMSMSSMSKEEIVNLPVCREASIHRRANSEAFAKYLYEEKIMCKNILNDWDYHHKHENVTQLLMETTFFEKCVYLCWSMAIQEPVMYLDDDLKEGIPLDKNTYKEFVKSGDTVVYVVWPALFLHRNGPLLYKGVAQASWKKAEQFV